MIAPPTPGARWGERFDVLEARDGGPGRLTFLARDRAFGTDVELWWILPGVHRDDAAVALEGGSGALRGLVHPSVRTLVDAGFAEGTTWAAYTLASPGVQPRERSPLPVPAVAAWARAVAAGLGAAHQRGWFHGRLVPADVVLVDGAVRVGGIALWVMAEPVSVAAWNAYAAYLAPEVVAGWTVGPAADVWGLAASVAALAAGTDRAIEQRGLLEARSLALAQALAGALVPDPAARGSLAELIARLDAVAAAAGPDAFAPVPSRMVAPPAFAPVPSRMVAPPSLVPPLPPPPALVPPLPPPPALVPPLPPPPPPVPVDAAPAHRSRPTSVAGAPLAAHPVLATPLPQASLPPQPGHDAFSHRQATAAVARSFRPGGQRPPTGQMAAAVMPSRPPSAQGPKVVMRPLSELSIVTVEPGEIGYVAPPRDLTPPAPRRRWVPVVGVLGGAATFAAIALVVMTQTGTDEPSTVGGPPADDDAAGGAALAPPPAPRLALSPVEPARGCTDQTLALGDTCVDPYEAPGKGQLPATGLTARAAADACAERGLRLCTPDEWRRACAGTERVLAEDGACNVGPGAVIAAAGGFERCTSAIEAHDLAGNVAEWVADGTALGGSALDSSDGRCDGPARPAGPDDSFADVGYRCCGDR